MAPMIMWMLTVASLRPIAFATPCEIGAASCVVTDGELESEEAAELGGHDNNLLQVMSVAEDVTIKTGTCKSNKQCKKNCMNAGKCNTWDPAKCVQRCGSGCACSQCQDANKLGKLGWCGNNCGYGQVCKPKCTKKCQGTCACSTEVATPQPTADPMEAATPQPTADPTEAATPQPTADPTAEPTPNPMEAEYWVSEKLIAVADPIAVAGSTACASGFGPIGDAMSCQSAAEALESTYESSGSWPGPPAGCVKLHNDARVWFNSYEPSGNETSGYNLETYGMICKALS